MMPTMPADAAELSSLTSSLHEIVERLTALAGRYEKAEREDLMGALLGAERGLRSAIRDIDRATRLLG
jgi:hypothetical protein